MTGLVPITCAPGIDPGAARITLELPEGLTVAQIVAQALPSFSRAHWDALRVIRWSRPSG